MNRAIFSALLAALVPFCAAAPNDSRLQPPKDLDGYFPFKPYESKDAWEKRAEELRTQMKVALGLWPMPEKTPLNAQIRGKQDFGDYTVERVYFESMPGFYVTGSLYRPKGKTGKLPAVLNPHGHWANGRFYDNAGGIAREIADGAERFEDSGRSPLQARCVQLARMGCVAFFYDMIGYADSQQISQAIAHGFAKQRPEMNSPEAWGLFSPQAEAHLQSVMGLQTWNSIRALDFVLSLDDVDPDRIGVTGASGGGTQTFVLCAIDPRPKVAFPAVMVSTAMQGGCTCENASLFRVGTGNIEFAALFAPKPMGMTAADDWTKEMETKGFPELKQHWKMMGAPDNVFLKPALHFGHNYNQVSRAAMYAWMNKHLKLGFNEPIIEKDFKRLSKEELTVWQDLTPKPESGPDFEKKLLKHWAADYGKKLAKASESETEFKKLVAPAINAILQRNVDNVGQLEFETGDKEQHDKVLVVHGLLKNTTHREEIPVVFGIPEEWNGKTVIWLSEGGKNGLVQDKEIHEGVVSLLKSGAVVAGIDLLYQGASAPDGKPVTQTRRVKNPREAAAYTFGYNHTLFAQRVHDVLTLLNFIKNHERKSSSIDLVALDATAPIAAVARAQSGSTIRRLVAKTDNFRFINVKDLHDVSFLPGGAKYGDLPGFLALGAPNETLLIGEKSVPELTEKIYRSANAADKVKAASKTPTEISEWLLQ